MNRSRRRRGQALIEYALLLVMLLGIFASAAIIIPNPINSIF